VPVQAIGGIGVALRSSQAPASLRRRSADLDLVTARKARNVVEHTLASVGLIPEEQFNAMHETNRQIWWLDDGETHIDLSPADLLLTKLQIVELNEKDVVDLGALLSTNPIVPVLQSALGLYRSFSTVDGPGGEETKWHRLSYRCVARGMSRARSTST
jgi:hypothetical protein